jgi:hypothetical protein
MANSAMRAESGGGQKLRVTTDQEDRFFTISTGESMRSKHTIYRSRAYLAHIVVWLHIVATKAWSRAIKRRLIHLVTLNFPLFAPSLRAEARYRNVMMRLYAEA